MNLKTNIYILLGFFLVSACELTKDIDEYGPSFALEGEIAITDETSAELALAGLYSGFLQGSPSGLQPNNALVASQMGITVGPALFNTNDLDVLSYSINSPLSTTGETTEIYGGFYEMINRANWLIEKLGVLDDTGFSEGRRTEIIGEAQAARALGNFYLLRLFGQFYDLSSEFGIVIRTKPARDGSAVPRSSVQASYDQILSDLDAAILAAPAFRQHYFMSNVFAKALKAKVSLYMEDFSAAATLAKEIIDDNTDAYALAPTFAEIFAPTPVSFNSTEALFSVYTGGTQGTAMANYFRNGFGATVSPLYVNMATTGSVVIDGQTIAYDGSRVALVTASDNGKYPGGQDTYFHLRMAELYLIYAEAEVRSGGTIANALEALNAIRARAGVDLYPGTITGEQFLEAIRIEKIMELATEGGEDWFDLVRYAYIDQGFEAGFLVKDYKSTATDPNKFILPIPQDDIDVTGGIVKQNPFY